MRLPLRVASTTTLAAFGNFQPNGVLELRSFAIPVLVTQRTSRQKIFTLSSALLIPQVMRAEQVVMFLHSAT